MPRYDPLLAEEAKVFTTVVEQRWDVSLRPLHGTPSSSREFIEVPVADAVRWQTASQEFAVAYRAAADRVNSTGLLSVDPLTARWARFLSGVHFFVYPWRNRTAPRPRLWWDVLGFGWYLRARAAYEADLTRLRAERVAEVWARWEQAREELHAAVAAYDAATGDLPALVDEHIARRKRERAALAVALGVNDGKVWSCRVTGRGLNRRFVIWSAALDGDAGGGPPPLLDRVTAREVHRALDKEREKLPLTPVRWGEATERAMREFSGPPELHWRSFNGAPIVTDLRPRPAA